MICERLYGLFVGLVVLLGMWSLVFFAMVIFWIAKAAFLEIRFLLAGQKACEKVEEIMGEDFAPWWRRELAIYVGFALLMAVAMWWDLSFPEAHFHALTLFFMDFVLAGAAIWSLHTKGIEYHFAQLTSVLAKHENQ